MTAPLGRALSALTAAYPPPRETDDAGIRFGTIPPSGNAEAELPAIRRESRSPNASGFTISEEE